MLSNADRNVEIEPFTQALSPARADVVLCEEHQPAARRRGDAELSKGRRPVGQVQVTGDAQAHRGGDVGPGRGGEDRIADQT
ncbi:hypothetical protein ACFVJ8_34235 [Streptomyces yangpuensis]|uniref:hypothetical protein n=1 Tax=Streptomyces yangpuensis TaxID=1648182 RepID=UPI0036425614